MAVAVSTERVPPADEDVQELLLAVVMTGGVSLAVWIGGVAHEINRLARGDHDVYRGVLELARTAARADVVTGSSAGGLNGAVLSLARVRNADIEPLRGVWLWTASLDRLMWPAMQSDPPSFLRGDYFLW